MDGEIIVANREGIPNFNALQSWRSEADGELLFYIFDLLWLNGKDLTQTSISKRKESLIKIMPSINNIRISESFEACASDFFEVAKKLNLEGIIAKKADSTYAIDRRSKEWLKIKTAKRHEVVIGGFTKNDGSNKPFSALLVGVNEKGKLKYTGKIGTGFYDKMKKEMMKKLKKIITNKINFKNETDVNKK